MKLSSEADDKILLNNPSALLQQYIPRSYLSLQNEIDEKVSEMKKKNLALMMHKKEF